MRWLKKLYKIDLVKRIFWIIITFIITIVISGITVDKDSTQKEQTESMENTAEEKDEIQSTADTEEDNVHLSTRKDTFWKLLSNNFLEFLSTELFVLIALIITISTALKTSWENTVNLKFEYFNLLNDSQDITIQNKETKRTNKTKELDNYTLNINDKSNLYFNKMKIDKQIEEYYFSILLNLLNAWFLLLVIAFKNYLMVNSIEDYDQLLIILAVFSTIWLAINIVKVLLNTIKKQKLFLYLNKIEIYYEYELSKIGNIKTVKMNQIKDQNNNLVYELEQLVSISSKIAVSKDKLIEKAEENKNLKTENKNIRKEMKEYKETLDLITDSVQKLKKHSNK